MKNAVLRIGQIHGRNNVVIVSFNGVDAVGVDVSNVIETEMDLVNANGMHNMRNRKPVYQPSD